MESDSDTESVAATVIDEGPQEQGEDQEQEQYIDRFEKFLCPTCRNLVEGSVSCAVGHRICASCFKKGLGVKHLEAKGAKCLLYSFCHLPYVVVV